MIALETTRSARAPRLLHRPSPARSDAELLGAVAEGDRNALAELYDRFSPLLLAAGERLLRSGREAEDLLHDVFLEVWRRAGDYDPRRGSARAWLFTRLRSRALDRLKSPGRARAIPMEGSAAEHAAGEVADPETGIDCALVRRAIEGLPADQRAIVELSYFEGLSVLEAAERLGVPGGTAKSRLSRALGKLREDLGVNAHDATTPACAR